LLYNPLLGLAAGDRIGGPIRMALMLGHSIADNSALDLTDIVRRYLAWYRTDAFDTGPGWSLVFKHIAAGVDPADAARIASKGQEVASKLSTPATFRRVTREIIARTIEDCP